MNMATKAAVLSGLVLPGLGQIVLRRYLRGALLLLASLASLAVLFVEAGAQASAIIENLNLVNAASEPSALIAEVSRVAQTSSGLTIRAASWLLMLLWLGGTVDAWRLGRKLDLQGSGGRRAGEGQEQWVLR